MQVFGFTPETLMENQIKPSKSELFSTISNDTTQSYEKRAHALLVIADALFLAYRYGFVSSVPFH